MSALPAPHAFSTALITGASSGIGAAIARELAGRGYGVTLVARREGRLRSLAQELATAHPIRAEAVSSDLTDPASRGALSQQLEALGLRVDLLINNAGIGSYGRFVDQDAAREVEQVRLLCEGVVALCAAFVPAMASRRCGAVLIVSSTTGYQPAARYATYGAAKAFSLSFGQSLHAELRRSGVAVTTVCPGPVETEFFAVNHVQPVALPKAMWTTPETVAHAAIKGLERNRRVVIPGAPMRLLMAGSRLSPPALQLRIMDLLLRERAAPKHD